MIRPSKKSVLMGAILAATLLVTATNAQAWWCGTACYRPAYYGCCYTPCCTPCYTVSCDPCCTTGGWYLGVRPGPIRRFFFGPYRWYYAGYSSCYTTAYCCTSTVVQTSEPCCGQETTTAKPATLEPTPAEQPEPTPAKERSIEEPAADEPAIEPEPAPATGMPGDVPNELPGTVPGGVLPGLGPTSDPAAVDPLAPTTPPGTDPMSTPAMDPLTPPATEPSLPGALPPATEPAFPALPGTTPAPATTPAPSTPPGISPAPTGSTQAPTRANSGLLVVWVPYDAKVTINGFETQTRGSQRRYVSHGLVDGFAYKYEVRAEVVRNGKRVEDVREVVLTAGDRKAVAFGFNTLEIEGLAAR